MNYNDFKCRPAVFRRKELIGFLKRGDYTPEFIEQIFRNEKAPSVRALLLQPLRALVSAGVLKRQEEFYLKDWAETGCIPRIISVFRSLPRTIYGDLVVEEFNRNVSYWGWETVVFLCSEDGIKFLCAAIASADLQCRAPISSMIVGFPTGVPLTKYLEDRILLDDIANVSRKRLTSLRVRQQKAQLDFVREYYGARIDGYEKNHVSFLLEKYCYVNALEFEALCKGLKSVPGSKTTRYDILKGKSE